MNILAVGLTGGIGSGKTTVAELFAKQGIQTIFSDIIAREAVLPKTEALAKIVQRYGEKILLENGELNRSSLRQIIFAQPEERIWLENLLHPIIHELTANQLAHTNSSYAIVEIPLLVGRPKNPLIDRVLLIDAQDNLRIQRVQARDQLSLESIQAIMAAQASRNALITEADDIIVNDHSLEELSSQVCKLHEFYLKLTH